MRWAALLWLITANANAVITDNLTIGNAKALALGHAVTADPPGIDSIHYNPAGLVRLKGRQAELKFVAGQLGVELKFDNAYTPSWSAKLAAAEQGAAETAATSANKRPEPQRVPVAN